MALVVEPSSLDGELARRILELRGWSVIGCESVADAAQHAANRTIALVCCRYAPDSSLDEESLAQLRMLRGSLPMLLVSNSPGAASVSARLQMMYLSEPFSALDMGRVLDAALIEFQPF